MPIEPKQLLEPTAINPNSYRAKQAAKAAAQLSPATVERYERRAAAAAAGRPENKVKHLSREQREKLRARSQEEFNDAVVTRLGRNVETLQHLADGIWVQEEDEDGHKRVYQKLPDRQALMFLLEHGIGKATAREKKTASPIINLVHRVPRSPKDLRAMEQEPEEELSEEPEDSEPGEPDDEDDDE